MRLILFFFLGLFTSFYLTDLISRTVQKAVSSLFGLALIILGLIIQTLHLLPSPLDILTLCFLLGGGVGVISYHALSRRYILNERFEKNFFSKHEGKVERFLEILPGALMWLALTSPLWLSFSLPFVVAYMILLADIYWLFTAIKIAVLVLIGYKRMVKTKSIDWLKQLQKDFPQELPDKYHLILLPTYKESLQILAPAFDAIAQSNYPKEKIFLAVGFEERDDPDKIKETSQYLKRYSKKIGGVFETIHPFGLAGEVPGPGSNRNWMMRQAENEFKKRGISSAQVLVTTLDADFVLHQQFLAGAMHKYLSLPTDVRDKISMTGVFLYNNNHWSSPTPMRLLAAGTSFWQLAEMVGSDKYINFASLSMNMQTILDIGMWIPDKVNDDSGFYWKAYYSLNGEYKVIPHYLPISADANLDTTLWKTFKNTYGQYKRWAYGVEHIPYIFTQYFKKDNLPFWEKTDRLFFITWSYFKWGTLALFITFGGLLIPLVNPHYSQSVLAVNLPTISSWILDGAFLGLFSTIYVHEKVVPKRPLSWNFIQVLWSYLQWALVPIILVSIATIPAIDAQTTLMLGKHLEFRVTNKARSLQT